MIPTSAYVHIPFCAAKCGYCDFNSHAGLLDLAPRYLDAMRRQILACRGEPSGELRTVYFGGGTPTVLPAASLVLILGTLRETFGVASDAEITLEANPESATSEKLRELSEGGFNRISIGAQAFDDAMLRRLGRVHSHERFLQAFSDARDAGFDNISIDLMFALPGQSLADLRETLDLAVALRPEHISAYCLTIEEDTHFWRLVRDGLLTLPCEDLQAEMFQAVRRALTGAGYEHYEVSNFALPGRRCRHNEVYWRNEPYWGFGTGAVQYARGKRTKWESSPREYVAQMESHGWPRVEFSECLTPGQALGETAMLALRTSDGLDLRSASGRFGIDAERTYAAEIGRFCKAGMLAQTGRCIRLTDAGMLLADEVVSAFLR